MVRRSLAGGGGGGGGPASGGGGGGGVTATGWAPPQAAIASRVRSADRISGNVDRPAWPRAARFLVGGAGGVAGEPAATLGIGEAGGAQLLEEQPLAAEREERARQLRDV